MISDKEKLLEIIREVRDDFREEKQSENFDEYFAYYYLGVLDSLFGLYFQDNPPNFSHRQKNEKMEDYIERILYEFFDIINS